jgi:hypothetical protein
MVSFRTRSRAGAEGVSGPGSASTRSSKEAVLEGQAVFLADSAKVCL